MTLSAVLYLGGCPQLADDPFNKVDGDGDDELPTGAGAAPPTSITTSTGGRLDFGGSGGSGGDGNSNGTSTTDSGNTGNPAGAAGTGGDGEPQSTNTATATTGGGDTSLPTTLIYATADNTIYSAAWDGAALAAATEWDTTEHAIGFVEARMAPDRSWALVGIQSEGDELCQLHLYRHFGDVTAPVVTLDIGESDSCLTARAFDIAFEQETGRGLLVYALPKGELAYHVIEDGSLSDRESVTVAGLNVAINWVRAVPDSASDRIAVGFTTRRDTRRALLVQEWDGSKLSAPYELVRNGCILNTESFDFAYYQGDLIALRGDATRDGFGYHLRRGGGMWQPEAFRPNTPSGNAQLIELRISPYGVAGALYDATGTAASFGTLLWRDGAFVEEQRLDNSLPAVSNFQPASQKTDLQRLGDAMIAVYVDDDAGDGDDTSSTLGWAVLRADTKWTPQQDTLPIPFDQASRKAVTRSLRLARFTAAKEGLLLAFAEDDGLYLSSLTDLKVGFTVPELVEAKVDGLSTTPFALIGP